MLLISKLPPRIALVVIGIIFILGIAFPFYYIGLCFPFRLISSLMIAPLLALIPFAILAICEVNKRIAIIPSILLLISVWGLAWRELREAGRNTSIWKGRELLACPGRQYEPGGPQI